MAASTSQGRPRTVFARALQTGNLVVAEGMARELGRISVAVAGLSALADEQPAEATRVLRSLIGSF